MLILGIETSCDETSVALVEDGRRLVASDVASQILMHAKFGGVVPELASRAHIQKLIPMVDECLARNSLALGDLDAIAVTLGPGLVGALLVGVETAKSLAFAAGKPLIPVHHIAGHLYSPMVSGPTEAYRHIVTQLDPDATEPQLSMVPDPGVTTSTAGVAGPALQLQQDSNLAFPYLGLVVSGGHSSLVVVQSALEFRVLGETVDDAAGEAFDKLAKLLNLGYPGGPLVEKEARAGNPAAYDFPRPMMRKEYGYRFSFSGLKTAALQQVRAIGIEKVVANPGLRADICASFQAAVVDVLLMKAAAALDETGLDQLAIVGGVACNGHLRAEAARRFLNRARVVFPPPALCTDNAAMIAGLAYHHRHLHPGCDLTLNAQANLPLGPVAAAG